jgi:DNA-binding transcriptional LysR family regulator
MRFMHNLRSMIDLVRSFLAVLDGGSINRAAATLHLSQPALSRQLMALESEVGGKLFERHPGGVRPTALAHSFAQRMRPVCIRSIQHCAKHAHSPAGSRMNCASVT